MNEPAPKSNEQLAGPERPRETDDLGTRDDSWLDLRGPARDAFGHPERVIEFARHYDWAANVLQFGDLTYSRLRQEICRFWSPLVDIRPEWIKLGLGSMAVMERNTRVFIERGSRVLGCHPQFIEYVGDLQVSGADYQPMLLDPAEGLRFDTASFLKMITPEHRMIYLDNPHNPTGHLIPPDEMEEVVSEAHARGVYVLVDEAYADLVDRKDSALRLIGRFDNLVVTRSFTKGYGLAGIRVGYGIYPGRLSDYYARVDTLLPIPAVAGELAAEAMLDTEFLPRLAGRVRQIKQRLITGLTNLGYVVPETHESTPIFTFGHRDEDYDLAAFMHERKIITVAADKSGHLKSNFVRGHVTLRAEELLARLGGGGMTSAA